MLRINDESENWLDRNLALVLRLMVLIIIIVIVMISTGYLKKIISTNPDITNCHEGTCKYSCNKETELQKYDTKCIDREKVCCITNNHIPSPECENKTQGDFCGNAMRCDEFQACISKCDYCSKYVNDSTCTTQKFVGRQVDNFDEKFKCGCTEMDCIGFYGSKLGTCVAEEKFCPSNNPGSIDAYCCKT